MTAYYRIKTRTESIGAGDGVTARRIFV